MFKMVTGMLCNPDSNFKTDSIADAAFDLAIEFDKRSDKEWKKAGLEENFIW